MTEYANIDYTLPGLSGGITAISYSGCCAIFNDGVLVGNGALLWTGQHIITAARVVDGLSPLSLSFKFDTDMAYDQPEVSSINIHPDYDQASFFNHNLAILTLAHPVTEKLSRYLVHLKMDASRRNFTRSAYGRTIDPTTGVYVTI